MHTPIANPAVFLRSRVYYVLPGNTTTLEARVHASSSSMAVVRWYHANRIINDANENSYTASSEGDIYRLEVNSVSESELGRYTVVVTLDGRMANDTTTLSYPGMYLHCCKYTSYMSPRVYTLDVTSMRMINAIIFLKLRTSYCNDHSIISHSQRRR